MNENVYDKLTDMLSKTADSKAFNNFNDMSNFSNIFSNFNQKNEKFSNINNLNNNFDINNLDIETIMKIKNVMAKMNSNQQSPRTNLLYSLKPFLNPSRKDKLDKYVQFINIASILEAFNKSGGDI